MAAATDNAKELRQGHEWAPVWVRRASEGQSGKQVLQDTLGSSDTGTPRTMVEDLFPVPWHGGGRAISLCHLLSH